MRYDWYAATIRERPERVVEVLAEKMQADGVEQMKGGRHGYTGGTEILRGGGVVAVVLAGGVNRWPSAKASGSSTENFVEVVRSAFGEIHHVSRLDACEDLDERGAFDRLYEKCDAVAKERGLKRIFIQSSGKNGNEGRTFYIGAPSSDCRVRLYEKGEEMRGKFPGRASEFSRDWIRLEAQIRPQEDARNKAATVAPREAWGFSQTSRLLARDCLGLIVPRIAGPRHDLTDYESSADHLALQYAQTLRYLAERSDSPQSFEKNLFRRMDRVDREKKTAAIDVPIIGKNDHSKNFDPIF